MRSLAQSILLLFCAGLLLGGCASVQGGGRIAAVREDFDPQSLQDDDFLLSPTDDRPGETVPRTPVTAVPSSAPPPKALPSPSQRVSDLPEQAAGGPVYRIQVAAVATPERAAQVQQEVARALGVPAYIQHDALFYKIQAGDLRARPEAERLLAQAQSGGYPGAFVISVPGIKSASPRSPEVPAETVAQRPLPQGGHPSLQMVPTQGYRVQVFSVADREEAQRFYEEARRRLGREDVYLQFEPPFFRVRVGNCRTRDAAEDLAREMEQAGYEAPFPVRTQILVPEQIKTGDE